MIPGKMPYEIDREHYQVRIYGTTDEIREWVIEISKAIDGGHSLTFMKDDLDNLERIVEPVNFTYGIYQRIYFNRDSILYAPNASGEGKKFMFKALVERFFEEARQKIESR